MPSLESIPADTDEVVVTAFQVQEITSCALFVSLVTTEESSRAMCHTALGVNPDGNLLHKREITTKNHWDTLLLFLRRLKRGNVYVNKVLC